MFCPNCGATLNEGAKFCMSCGKPVPSLSPPPPTAAEPVYTPPVYEPPPPSPAPVPAYTPPAYEPPPAPPAPPPPPESVYMPPAYEPPPPSAPPPVYTPPAYEPPPPAYAPPAYEPPPPAYAPPAYAHPPSPPTPEPAYAPPPTQPQSYTPPQYGQPQASPYATRPAPSRSDSSPSFLGALTDKLSMPVLMIIGGAALLLVVFAALWLFTGIFSPKADAGKAPDSVVAKEEASEPEDENGIPETSEPDALSPSSGLEGFYALVEMDYDGQDMLELYESMDIDLAGFYIEITGDSTMNIASMGDVSECSFSIDGNTIKVTFEGDTIEGTIEGNRITLDFGGGIMVYERDPNFIPAGNSMAADPGVQEGIEILSSGGNAQADGEADFIFSPNATGVWTIWTSNNGNTDPQIWVYDSNGAELAWDDDSAGNKNALLGLYLKEGETYTIRAGSFASEVTYILNVSRSSSVFMEGGTVDVNNPKVLAFRPKGSGSWVFETTNNGNTNPYLIIFDSNNRHIVSDDDSGEGLNARIVIDLEEGEEYIIMALTADDDPGPYELVVEKG